MTEKVCHVCGKPYPPGTFKEHAKTLTHVRGSSSSKRIAKTQPKPGGLYGWKDDQ